MVIETTEFVIGIFSLMIVAVYTFVGLTIASRYFKYKNRIFLLMGFAWVFMCCPWWPSSVSFLLAITTGNGLPIRQYVLIGNILLPLITLLLIISYMELKFPDKVKKVAVVFTIITVAFEIYLIYFVIVDVSQLAELRGIVDIEYRGLLRYYMLASTVFGVIVGILIGIDGLKSDQHEIRWKGRFLIIAFLLFPAGAWPDAIFPLTIPLIIFCRIIMITSAIMFYFGFLMPNWMKNLLKKKE